MATDVCRHTRSRRGALVCCQAHRVCHAHGCNQGRHAMILPIPMALLWAVEASRLEGVPVEWPELQRIFKREVGTYYPTSRHTTTRNPRSSAFGLGQFLNSTWRGTGIAKTNDPIMQIRGIYRYCKRRYGSVAKALAFHRRRGFY